MKTGTLNHQMILKPRRRFVRTWKNYFLSVFCVTFVGGVVHLMMRQNYFALRNTQIVGDLSELSVEEILKSAKVPLQKNLFQVSLKEIESNILTLPWVSQVSVRRQIPSTLWIHVKEQKAKALLLDQELHFISDQGEVFKKVETEKVRDLPVFTGFAREDNLEEALKLLNLFEEDHFFERLGVSEIDYHPVFGFSVMTALNPMQVYLGKDRFQEKLSQLQIVWPEIEKRLGRIRGIDFDDVDKIFVKL